MRRSEALAPRTQRRKKWIEWSHDGSQNELYPTAICPEHPGNPVTVVYFFLQIQNVVPSCNTAVCGVNTMNVGWVMSKSHSMVLTQL